MATLRHWVQAARPLAQANLAAPLLLGQAFAYYATGRFDFRVLLALALWGVLDQLFIVFANDVADREHDEGGEAKTLFSGGSGVLPEGKLTASALLRGAFAAYALLGVLSLVLAAWRTPWAIAFWPGLSSCAGGELAGISESAAGSARPGQPQKLSQPRARPCGASAWAVDAERPRGLPEHVNTVTITVFRPCRAERTDY